MILRTLIDELWKVFAAFFLITILTAIAVFFYPSLSENLDSIINIAPKMFVDLVASFFIGGYGPYIAGQHFFKNINMVCSIFAVLFATAAIARESERGTLELLLSCPVSRSRIVLTKFSTSAIGLAIPIFISSIIIIPMSNIMINESIALKPLLLCSIHSTIVVWVILAYSFLLSALINDQIKVIAIALSISFFMLLLVVFKQVEKLSLYYYGHVNVYRDIFLGKSYPYAYSIGLLALIILLLAATLVFFYRKDA